MSEVRKQLGELDELLSVSEERDQKQKAQLKNVGSRLNQALASLASEERKRRKLEENERKRLEEERKKLEEENSKLTNQAEELASYKSEFFGRMRQVLKGQERVSIVGDRFIFSSEVLFSRVVLTSVQRGKPKYLMYRKFKFYYERHTGQYRLGNKSRWPY